MGVSKAVRPYLIQMNAHLDPLHRFEAALPQTRAALLKLWSELGAAVHSAAPARYYSVQEALEQDVPFPVLVMYVFREARRALEKADAEQRKAE
ncbi:MAG: hypothetical protein C4331_02145 [Meiothermus sp.]